MLAGKDYLLFDVGGTIGIAGMGVALLWSVVKHIKFLYSSETRPRAPVMLAASRGSEGMFVRAFARPMLTRWLRFNAVGIAGFAVQLGALWLFARVWGLQYLLATALAVEIALLHNFVWHEAWTWKGLAVEGRWRRLTRFHLGNGFLSIVSNVLFTWILMQGFGMPLLVANAASVAVTALLNFAVAAVWVFRVAEVSPAEPCGAGGMEQGSSIRQGGRPILAARAIPIE
jgi:putative flippase GtrA